MELKKNWTPDEGAFRRLLGWLDEGVDSGGEKYLDMRRRLEFYFERRGCRAPDELADETLNRVARRLDEETTITTATPARFCYITAKFVFHESLRNRNAVAHPANAQQDSGDSDERVLACLDECLRQLDEADRELIIEYYRGEQRAKIEQRRALAARLGLSMNALGIRACRLRDKLEACVKAGLKEK